jgi:hypothetical protein
MAKPQAPEAELRSAIGLEDLLGLLVKSKRLAPERAQDVAARARTLASQVLKEKVSSVRSQAAARYEVSPAEIVTAAKAPKAGDAKRTLDEGGRRRRVPRRGRGLAVLEDRPAQGGWCAGRAHALASLSVAPRRGAGGRARFLSAVAHYGLGLRLRGGESAAPRARRAPPHPSSGGSSSAIGPRTGPGFAPGGLSSIVLYKLSIYKILTLYDLQCSM